MNLCEAEGEWTDLSSGEFGVGRVNDSNITVSRRCLYQHVLASSGFEKSTIGLFFSIGNFHLFLMFGSDNS